MSPDLSGWGALDAHTLARDHRASPYAGRVASQPSRSRTGSLPVGTLTFLFTDIEGSTRLVAALGQGFGPLIERHHAVLRAAFDAVGGIEVSTEGDAFFVVFQSAVAAVTAAAAAQRSLAAEPWPPGAGAVRVRMGLHTGEGILGGDDYMGLDIHRAARIAGAVSEVEVEPCHVCCPQLPKLGAEPREVGAHQ